MSTPENLIGVEVVANAATAEANLDLFVSKAVEADRVLQDVGKKATFGEDVARQTEKAQAGVEQTTKAVEQSAITIDRSYTRAAQAVQTVADAGKTGAQIFREQELAARASGNAVARAGQTAAETSRAAAEAAKAATVAYQYTDREVETLRKNLRATRDEALQLQRALARQGRDDESRAAAGLARKAGRGLERLDAGAEPAVVDAAARSAQGSLRSLRQENRQLQREVGDSGGLLRRLQTSLGTGIGTPLASLASGLLGGAALTVAVQKAVELVEKYRDLQKEGRAAQQELSLAARDTGADVAAQQRAVESLRESYGRLRDAVIQVALAEAERGRKVPVTQSEVERQVKAEIAARQGRPEDARILSTTDNEATRRLQQLPDEVIVRAAYDAATRRGLDKSKLGDYIRDTLGGKTEVALGVGDEEVLARFSGLINKLPSEFTEVEKRLARINELVLQQSPAFTSAERAVETYMSGLSAGAKDGRGGVVESLFRGLSEGDAERLRASLQQARGEVAGYTQAWSDAGRAQDEETQAALRRIVFSRHATQQREGQSEEFGRSTEEAARRRDEEARKEVERQKQIEQAVRQARAEFEGFSIDLAQRQDPDNQFVGMFIRFREELEETRRKFAPFGDEFVAQAERMLKVVQDNEAGLARFQSQLSALRDRQEADRLDRSLIGLSGLEEQEVEVTRAQTRAAVDVPRLLLEASRLLPNKQFQSPVVRALDERRLLDDQLRKLEQLLRLQGGAFGTATNKVVDEQLLAVTGQINPRVLATSSDPLIRAARDARGGALTRTAASYEEETRQAVARAQATGQIRRDVEAQLKLLRSSNLAPGAELKAFLDISGTLPDNELTGDLRRGRAEAFRDRARREEHKEKEGEDRAKRLDDFLKLLDRQLKGRGIKIDASEGNKSAVLRIVTDDPDVSVEKNILPPTPRTEDAVTFPDGFQPGRRRPGDIL